MSKEVSPTFCILPWIHVSTKTNGEMRLCCTTCASSAGKNNEKELGGKLGVNRDDNGLPANFHRTPLLKGWNNQYMQTVRKQMLAGEKPPSCAKCYKEEEHGLRSKRLWETEYWSHRVNVEELVRETDADGRVPDKIRYFDLRLGHHCNLRCTMCSPHDSSGWVDDWDQIYPQIQNDRLKHLMAWGQRGKEDDASYDWYKNPEFWKDFDTQIPYIRQIYFAGGEPMLIEEHFQLLERIIEKGYAKKVELRYNSNGTLLPERILKLWDNFYRVRFGLSLDSFEKINYYVRFPANWKAIEKNLRRLDETGDHIEVNLACAVQALNIFYVPDFIKWKLAQNFKKINMWPNGAGLINYHLVYHPAFLNVRILPKEIKAAITQKFDEFYKWLEQNYRNDDEFKNHAYGPKRLKSLVDFMNGDDWSVRWPEFQEYITRIDSIRAAKFEDCLPEFAQLIQKCGYDFKLRETQKSSLLAEPSISANP